MRPLPKGRGGRGFPQTQTGQRVSPPNRRGPAGRAAADCGRAAGREGCGGPLAPNPGRPIATPALPLLVALLGTPAPDPAPAPAGPLTVELDASQVPHLSDWGEEARGLLVEWHPRFANLLPTEGFTPPNRVRLVLEKTDEGVAATSGAVITVSSHWIEKRPEDLGLAVHELVHVVQSYPPGSEWWVTEGIADYLRWAIYEGKPQSWFARPREPQGYRRGYRDAAGFLLWLETGPSPGVVNRVNTALRRGEYSADLFTTADGRDLDGLWDEYVGRN